MKHRKRWLFLIPLLLAAGAGILAFRSAPRTYRCRTAGNGPWKLVWSDEFEGDSLDEASWNIEVGKGCWGNEQQEYCTDGENLAVRGGCLEIISRYDPDGGEKTYTSSRINTAYKVQVQYGRIEARIKLPVGQGLWPAFWMLGTDRDGIWPWCGEIDILEAYGKFNVAQGTLIWPRQKPNSEDYWLIIQDKRTYLKNPEDWHEYAVEWGRDRVDWFLDGERYHSYEIDRSKPEFKPFSKPFYIVLNTAIGGTIGGEVDNTVFPKTMYVDYVRVYSR